MRLVLIGDAQSPHLLKWARALAAAPGLELWAISSRGFMPAFDAVVPLARRLALDTQPVHVGGNGRLLMNLPRVARWLSRVDADWLHPHYLTSHGTLAWLAKRLSGLRAGIVGSAWGSDILVTPQRSFLHAWLARRILRNCTLATSDSAYMAERMRALGAPEVMTFAFGLEALPTEPVAKKTPWLFFANRGLEPIYRPDRVLALFAEIAARQPTAQLVIANSGSLAAALPDAARALGLSVGALANGQQLEFVGRLDATAQAGWYDRAQWYLSLPQSDSVSVSLLEAMAHGCIPLVSDLPANRELVRDHDNGGIVTRAGLDLDALPQLLDNAAGIARVNRAWIGDHGLFEPAVARFLVRLRELTAR